MKNSKKKATEQVYLNVGPVETFDKEKIKALQVERVATYANILKKKQ